MAGGGEATTLEYTPTWVVALVCTVIVSISLAVERILHYLGKYFKKKKQNPLYEALLKIKEELMLLGFISLLLTVFQDRINEICMAKHLADEWLPCKKKEEAQSSESSTAAHFQITAAHRHLLAEASGGADFCTQNGKVPLLSTTALHHLHIFIFVLAVVHVAFCALTILFGGVKIRQWKHWEDSILKEEYNPEEALKNKLKFTQVKDHSFIRGRFSGLGKNSALLGWLQSFFKQFYGSVTKSDYTTLRLGFIMTHCRGNPKFNFHKYMIRALEADFKKVVGINWYLWLFVVVFLSLNVNGWHAYFWIAFIPLILLLSVGTKLEHVISQLAHEVAEKHVALEGDLVVKPSDEHFWFHRPRLVLLLIHIILFQNSFEFAVFLWILYQYTFDSCIMGNVGFIIPRLVIGIFVQFLCSYSTLPLYALVTQMGTSFKKAIFVEPVLEGIDDWAQRAHRNKGLRKATNGSRQVGPKVPSPAAIQMVRVVEEKESEVEEGNTIAAGEIKPAR
ncbi:MLO-like protein 1 [Rhododendron vialii]|uniref:MLO-like protein 1 n=1 Tax=Rhododendron vialii TaxID=182163 RepID=UPI00265FF6F6|nr:MLO-like protein 1 [Rhododendron vialii]